ncbi:MAG: histidinol-phosphate transaminase [Candidatus Goldiibacteriota bacterium]
MNIGALQKKSIRGLKPYDPGLLVSYKYKLDANENGFDITAAARKKLLKKISALHFNRYPDPGTADIRKILAKKNGIKAGNIAVGNGSDEIIHYIIQAFTDSGDSVVFPHPTFEMYRILSLANGAKPVASPLDERFDIDPDDILKKSRGAKIIFLAYPNNPTGNCFSRKSVERVIKKAGCLVVVDEAYYEFSNKTFINLLGKHKNLIILRTFSKAFSMAGARLGYMLAGKSVIDIINKVRLPYNVNALSQACAGVMLGEKKNHAVEEILKEKEIMYDLLKADYPVVKSDANFLLIKVKNGGKAVKIFAENGISIRIFRDGVLKDFLRLTIGMPEENRAALKILRRGV